MVAQFERIYDAADESTDASDDRRRSSSAPVTSSPPRSNGSYASRARADPTRGFRAPGVFSPDEATKPPDDVETLGVFSSRR